MPVQNISYKKESSHVLKLLEYFHIKESDFHKISLKRQEETRSYLQNCK